MNWHLFSAFLLITVVLFLTPGPIVTLIVATGARQGTRAALATVGGATSGNAVLLGCIVIVLDTADDERVVSVEHLSEEEED
jgi:homoserine/homoserine lactone efflux protein